MPKLLSVNVGLPKDVEWEGKTVHTGIWKRQVDGPRMVRKLNIDGDGQGDLKGHGGPNRAVLVYQIQSHRYWQKYLNRDDFSYGEFGENFTVDGLPDDEVCVGDRYRIGEAEFEVTQPRVTCFRVGMRLGEPKMAALLVGHHRPGFYLRVITEGHVQAGDDIVRTRQGPHALSIADIDALLYLPHRDMSRVADALDIPALSPGWQQSFHEMVDAQAKGRDPDAPPVGVEPAWKGFRTLRVSNLVHESSSVVSVYLEPDDDQPFPKPKAGQFLTVRVQGAGDPAPVRSYSLSSDPASSTYRISIKREPHGTVSSYLPQHLKPGATVDAAAPRGDFVLTDEDNPIVLISAGIGLTPELAMLHHLAATNSHREVWWIHSTRDAQQHAFAHEARELLDKLRNSHEHTYYTSKHATVTPTNAISRGRLTPEKLADLGVPGDAIAYICGPTAFMTAIGEALVHQGLDSDRVHTELFGTRPAINPGVTDTAHTPPHQPAGPAGTGPLVTFTRSGLSVRWADQYHSILELAEASDVPTRYSCRTGVCHTCVTPILSGGVLYDPDPLEPPDQGEVLICCSHPEGDVILDI